METFISLVIIWLVATWLLASSAAAITNQKNQQQSKIGDKINENKHIQN